MSQTTLKKSSQRFLKLLRLSIISFICMGVLIGYHGAPLLNSFIGAFWFVFAVTAGMVVATSLTKESESKKPGPNVLKLDKMLEKSGSACNEKRIESQRSARSDNRQKISGPA